MRIALLSVSAEMGGSEASLVELVRGLRRLAPHAEPIVVVPRDGRLSSRVRECGAGVRVLPMPDGLASFGEWSMRGAADVARRSAALVSAAGSIASYGRALRSTLAGIAPDVVHTNGFKLHVLVSRAAPSRMPLVWHMHEYVSHRPLSRALLRHYTSRVAAIVANSHSVADDLIEALGAAAPVSSIYNAVDLAEFAPGGPVADLDGLAGLPPAAPNTIRIGLVATFARWKGHETFLRAVGALGRLPIRAYVIGGPVYDTAGSQYTIEELRARAMSLGVADRVGFTGFIERPASAIRALDVAIHASTQPEPFGLAIAEAMACGRATVVSAGGGAAELVANDADALTFDPGDAEGLARAIYRFAVNSPLRARLGAAARQTAVRRFDPDTFVRRFLDVYERAARPTGAAVR